MKMNRPQLEQHARELRARGVNDRAAVNDLCMTLWALGQQDQAIEAFTLLLQHEPDPADAEFDEIYLAGLLATSTCPTPMRRRDRLMQLIEILRETATVAGNVVECGCFRGLSSYLMCSYLRRWDARFDGNGYHIFDSFEGLSEPTADDEVPDDWDNAEALRIMTQRGYFAASCEQVSANLREFPHITYHRGWIPLTFKSLPEIRYRFVHVDVDLYDPTLDACNYFYQRLSPGGVIVSDDYSWPGARTAIDEFCADHGLECQITPANQAIIRKGRATTESSDVKCS